MNSFCGSIITMRQDIVKKGVELKSKVMKFNLYFDCTRFGSLLSFFEIIQPKNIFTLVKHFANSIYPISI